MSALIRRLLAVALVVTSAIVISPAAPTAVAAGTPDIVVTSSMAGQVLVGENITISIEVANPGGPDGYNTLIRDVLPAGVSYVPGSSDPEPLQYPQIDGTTVLVWSNVADSLTGTTIGVSFILLVRDDVGQLTYTFLAGDDLVANLAYPHQLTATLPAFPAVGVATTAVSSGPAGYNPFTALSAVNATATCATALATAAISSTIATTTFLTAFASTPISTSTFPATITSSAFPAATLPTTPFTTS